jgi:hypothetical protein
MALGFYVYSTAADTSFNPSNRRSINLLLAACHGDGVVAFSDHVAFGLEL